MSTYIVLYILILISYSEANLGHQGPKSDNLMVFVNDLKLVPLPSDPTESNRYEDKYLYKYIDGDPLNITCRRNEAIQGRLRFVYDQNLKIVAKKISTRDISILLNSTNFNKFSIKCCIDNSDLEKNSADILFLAYLPSTEFSSGNEKQLVMILGCSIGIIIFIVTVICSLYWYRRIKNTKLAQNAYENFSNQYDSPIPEFPDQWQYVSNDYDYPYNFDGTANLGNIGELNSVPQNSRREPYYNEIDYTCDTVRATKNNPDEDNKKESSSYYDNDESNPSIDVSYDKLRHSNIIDNNFYSSD